jgi:uncharacterized YigZ family protein
MRDHYRTPAEPVEYSQKIERSEFLAIVFPIASDEAFFAQLEALQKRWFDATHHCWAFRLMASGETRARSSDAGEPSGTAGKPILAAIEGADLFDAGVVVVRWYGGVKLGTGGLQRAYRGTAAAALAIVKPRDVNVYERVSVVVPFEKLSTAYRLVAPPDVVLTGEHFGERNEFLFDVRRSMLERFTDELTSKRFTFEVDRGKSVN